jgi:hypothetical protein
VGSALSYSAAPSADEAEFASLQAMLRQAIKGDEPQGENGSKGDDAGGNGSERESDDAGEGGEHERPEDRSRVCSPVLSGHAASLTPY